MTITVECEWDDDEMRCTEVSVDGRSVPYLGDGVKINRAADELSRLIGVWKLNEDGRNVDL